MKCRPSANRHLAVLQINQVLNNYSLHRIQKMIEALGYSLDNVYSQKPNWEAIRGKLFFEGKCARTVRRYNSPSNVQKVLALFQDKGWPHCVNVSRILDTLNTRDTIKSLNTDLDFLKFSAQSGGSEICWEKR